MCGPIGKSNGAHSSLGHDARLVTPCESNLPCEVTLIHAETLLSVDFVFQILRVITADLKLMLFFK